MKDQQVEWNVFALGEVVEVLDHKRVPVNAKERAQREGDVPYYGATGRVGWIDDFLFDEELVLLGEDGVQFLDAAVKKAYIVHGKSWVNNHAHVLRPLATRVNAQFLAMALNLTDYSDLVNGATRLKLTKSAMLRIKLMLPPVEVQNQVVERVNQLHAMIDQGLREAQVATDLLMQFETSVIEQALTDQATRDGTVKLGSLADIRYGWTAKTQEVGLARMLRITDIQDGRVNWESVPRCEIPEERFAEFRLLPGDIVFARTGATTGKSYLVGDDVPKDAIFASYLIRVRPGPTLNPEFLALFFRSAAYWRYVRAESRGIGQPNVNGSILAALPVPQLSPQDQTRAAERATTALQFVEQTEADAEEALRLAEAIKRSVVRQAVAGQLVSTPTAAKNSHAAGAVA